MLNSFLIENFRLFKHLELPRLGRVNLVVGRNNAGKSALLEAIELYASGASTKVLLDQIKARQETWSNQPQTTNPRNFLNPVRHLFYQHRLPDLGDKGITLGPLKQQRERIKLQLVAYSVEQDEEGIIRRTPIASNDIPDDLSGIEIVLAAQEDGKTRRILRLDQDLQYEYRNYQRTSSLSLLSSSVKYITQFVPTRNMTEERIASLWDSIYLTGLDDEVIKSLQLIEKTISGIGFVEDRNSRTPRIPVVKIDNASEPLPLKSMGDGVIRLFHITVAVANARDGILLIDEFENGLHWSVQPKVWLTVFRLAERLNVQVFASTHSRDCIQGFEIAWREYIHQGEFFRLSLDREQLVTARYYTHETLADALEMDVEVR